MRSREYVEQRVGAEFLVPLLGEWDRPSEIPFDELSPPFVLKVTHSSGGNVFCFEGVAFSRAKAMRALNHHLKVNAYYFGCEWAYKDIRPRIVCEKLLLSDRLEIPYDYKVFCCNGTPTLIQVDVDRFSDHRRNFYSTRWEPLPVKLLYENADKVVERPPCLEEMLHAARELAGPFPFARVDFYVHERRPYFGEITFYPEGGSASFDPDWFEAELGRSIALPQTRS